MASQILSFLKRIFLAVVVGLSTGVLSAFFLFTLSWVTQTREQHIWLIWLLPLGAAAVGWIYLRFGSSIERGHDLIVDEIHAPTRTLPFRMIPLVLAGTWLTHLFGGSAGREGAAVQMGAAFADRIGHTLKFKDADRATLLMCGLSAGFGSVFGVPIAGAIFGMEVIELGRLRWKRCTECLLASTVGHFTVLFLGVKHTAYARPLIESSNFRMIAFVAIAGLIFGIFARIFVMGLHLAQHKFRLYISNMPLRAAVGGALVLGGYLLVGNFRYAGLGVPVIEESLRVLLPAHDFILKSLFTILTIGSGLKGGEVTPLLFIGSTLGNSLSLILPIHFSLLAALGLVSVFAGASNAPLACAFMAAEIFGTSIFPLALLSSFVSYAVSGPLGIYRSQRRSTSFS